MAETRVNDRQLDLSEVDQNIRVASSDPAYQIRDTDVALPDGLWRLRLANNTLQFQNNSAVAGDFSSVLTVLQVFQATADSDTALTVNKGVQAIAFRLSPAKDVADANTNEIFRYSGDNRLHIKDNGSTDRTIAYLDEIPAAVNFVTREVPSGDIDSMNTVFTLANTPTMGSEEVFLNGLLQNEGVGNDYEISGDTITFTVAPVTGSVLLVSYRF